MVTAEYVGLVRARYNIAPLLNSLQHNLGVDQSDWAEEERSGSKGKKEREGEEKGQGEEEKGKRRNKKGKKEGQVGRQRRRERRGRRGREMARREVLSWHRIYRTLSH